MNGAHLIFYVVSGLLIWGVFLFRGVEAAMTNPIPAVRHAGLYRPATGRETTCKHANNPYGHNPECGCGWARPPQVVPYLEEIEEPEPDYPVSKHERW